VAENIYLGELPKGASAASTGARSIPGTDAILEKLKVGFNARTLVGRVVHRQPADGRDRPRADGRRQGRDLRRADRVADRCREGRPVRRDRGPQGAGRRHHLHLAPDGGDLQDHRPHLGSARRLIPGHARHRRDQRGRDHADDDRPQARPQPEPRTCGTWRRRAEVEGLSCGDLYQDATFEVREGEVLGFYGLVGAGGPRSPRPCSACASRRRGDPAEGRRSRSPRPSTPSPRASRWCPRAARNRASCSA
jgi:hypothetical protein